MPDSSSKKQIVIAAIGLAAIVFAVRSFLAHRTISSEKQGTAMHKRGGHVIARLAAKIFADKTHVLMIVPDQEKLDEKRGAWMKEMKEACESGVTVEGSESLAAMLSRIEMASNRPTVFTLAVYRDFLKKHPGATAVISLIGEPLYAPGEAISKDEKFPPMICFSPSGDRVPELMAQGIIAAAIVPRSGPPGGG